VITFEDVIDFLADVGAEHSVRAHPEHSGPKPGCYTCMKHGEAIVTIGAILMGKNVKEAHEQIKLDERMEDFSNRHNTISKEQIN
jgi:hypothetical protein